jgi:anaerobic magnesium-protoporphyrin IX monomethyl ester cyclase
MKINMVSFEDGIIALGFRKMAAYMERMNPDTHTYYVGSPRYRSMWKSFRRTLGNMPTFTPEDYDTIASDIADADIVAVSSMTGYADMTKDVLSRVRQKNPNAYVMWGGIHPIVYPEDAILADIDALCIGEGEFPFEEFFENFKSGKDFTNTRNFWFKSRNGEVKRNSLRPLMTNAELDSLPFGKYGGEEWLYRTGEGFSRITTDDYLHNNGLGYNAIWTIGCPLHCTFCANTVFIQNDAQYKKIRHSSPAYMVAEVEHVRKVHPHVTTVLFNDDSFMGMPNREILEFATLWREKLQGVQFVVYGVIPTLVHREKFEMLTWAGMQRVRMGIQSGSERMLNFYKRPIPIPKVEHAAEVIAEFKKYQLAPSFDFIVDNPVETRQDVIDTLELVYRLARPFTLNVLSLRIIPNTVLEQQMLAAGFDVDLIDANYLRLRPTWSNMMMFLMLWWRPPRRIFDWMLSKARAYNEPQKNYPLLLSLARIPWLFLQGYRHLRWGEFSVITGKFGYYLWKLGLLQAWWKIFRPKYEMPVKETIASTARELEPGVAADPSA